jgi:hypothetical protein
MKNPRINSLSVFIGIICIVFTSFVFQACEKNINVDHAYNDLFELPDSIVFAVENNFLVFESEETFQCCINYLAAIGDENFPLFEKEIGFESYRKRFTNDLAKSELFPDELYSTLLNPEMEIIVENYLFKEDPVNNKTYVYLIGNQTDKNLKSVSITEKIPDFEFCSDDDILARLKGEPESKGKYCDGIKLGYFYWSTSGGHVQYKIVYQTGLYKSLQAKIKKDHDGGAEYISLETYWDETSFYRNKKGCWTYTGSDGGYGREYNLRPYYSTRRLKAFRYKVSYYCSDYGYTPAVIHSDILKIVCKEYDDCN